MNLDHKAVNTQMDQITSTSTAHIFSIMESETVFNLFCNCHAVVLLQPSIKVVHISNFWHVSGWGPIKSWFPSLDQSASARTV